MKNSNLIQKLSDIQMDAISADDNILLVAIPGSGKTRTLTNKILYEYDCNDIKKTVAITYTKRAADEMRERIVNQIGEVPNNIWIGTIHKFCLDFIIRKYSRFSQRLSKPFSIIGEDDLKKLKDRLLEKYKLSNDYNINYTLDVNGNVNETIYTDYVKDYYNELFRMKKIDFNYILYESYKLLRDNVLVARNLSHIIRFLCIDEYQDTQELQYQILSLIVKQNKKIGLFIVGDPNQAIYTGLGGVVKSKAQLEVLFGVPFVQKQLDCCYRSHQEIIDFYSIFALEKFEMKSGNYDYSSPYIEIDCEITSGELVNRVRDILIDLRSQGIEDKEICIVAPQWHFLYDFSNKLRKELPDFKFDAPNVLPLKRDDENVIYKLCKIFLTKYSFTNKNRILFIVQEIMQQLKDEYGIDLHMNRYDLLKNILASRTSDEQATLYLKNSLISFFNNINVLEIFYDDIHDFVLTTEMRIETYKRFGLEDDKLSLERSLRSREGVVVSTAHSIKGEEYRAVIAFGLLEGYLPHWNSIYGGTAREDSKRLLFVICSRAKDKLYLLCERDRVTKRGELYKVNVDIKNVIDRDLEII